MIQETKLDCPQAESFGLGFGHQYSASKQVAISTDGASGDLLIMWKPTNTHIEGVASNRNRLLVKVLLHQSNVSFLLLNVYGPPSPIFRHALWLDLESVISQFQDQNLLIGGDFNAIRSFKDKRGGITRLSRSQQDFNDWIDRNGLFEIELGESAFTGNNHRQGFSNIAKKIDRFFWLGDFSSFPFTLECYVLPYSGSDQYLLLLSSHGESTFSKLPFRFENMWMKDANFLTLISHWWKEVIFEGSKLFCFVSKLKYVKKQLLNWNTSHFKNIFTVKKNLEAQLEDLNEKVIQEGMTQNLFLEEKHLLAEYEDILSKEEIFWKQKSREGKAGFKMGIGIPNISIMSRGSEEI
ncbi:uncharacterized protein LOC131874149 [Cryptomeria japonica]|uniref:uncharacterized protein LOC131874149 n=1 Tax=Cryptomeria japonica TaxID=3369 RepID=UPI0027D9FB2D|nr:uncharacterized protein LOC131874149 [Cryptomeria japonica]